MNYGLSTRLIADERLSSRLLDRILEAGFRDIEIFAAPEHFNYADVNHVRDAAQWFSDRGVGLHSVHAPLFSEPGWGRRGGIAVSVAYAERRLCLLSMDEIKRTLEAAERLPFRFLVLHLGLEQDEYDLAKLDAAFTSIEHLRIFAKERGVSLLLENTVGQLGTPARVVQFLTYTHLDDVGICFDAGHAHLGGDAVEGFRAVRDRVRAVHLHDNHGEKDEHLMPFEGGIDWPGLIGELAAAASETHGFSAFLELQSQGHGSALLDQARETAVKLEALEKEATADRPE